ncbi:cysteine synthase B [Vibrio maritimus]|uniref:Cysteine synthase B n=1 Tax=Vibrio maritimus TaxID=990268 RepID=A0A090TUF8_9VIBR|nr:cysteine synthase B [Vibrio maritimus]
MCTDHQWINNAVRKLEADFQRSADTHLIKLDLPSIDGIDVYLKDESTHPTGSLKHRLARSLFLYAICNGWIGPETTVIESSSGSTAVSEAYFARLLGLPFIAVMPKCTARKKIEQIEFYGGKAHLVDRSDQIYAESRRLAEELDGHYMDQFTYAERATDWRGNNNIANSIFSQMKMEDHPVPSWIVMSQVQAARRQLLDALSATSSTTPNCVWLILRTQCSMTTLKRAMLTSLATVVARLKALDVRALNQALSRVWWMKCARFRMRQVSQRFTG